MRNSISFISHFYTFTCQWFRMKECFWMNIFNVCVLSFYVRISIFKKTLIWSIKFLMYTYSFHFIPYLISTLHKNFSKAGNINECSSVNGWIYRNMSDSYKFRRFSFNWKKKKKQENYFTTLNETQLCKFWLKMWWENKPKKSLQAIKSFPNFL